MHTHHLFYRQEVNGIHTQGISQLLDGMIMLTREFYGLLHVAKWSSERNGKGLDLKWHTHCTRRGFGSRFYLTHQGGMKIIKTHGGTHKGIHSTGFIQVANNVFPVWLEVSTAV